MESNTLLPANILSDLSADSEFQATNSVLSNFDITEEDLNLAAALVAVQQKQLNLMGEFNVQSQRKSHHKGHERRIEHNQPPSDDIDDMNIIMPNVSAPDCITTCNPRNSKAKLPPGLLRSHLLSPLLPRPVENYPTTDNFIKKEMNHAILKDEFVQFIQADTLTKPANFDKLPTIDVLNDKSQFIDDDFSRQNVKDLLSVQFDKAHPKCLLATKKNLPHKKRISRKLATKSLLSSLKPAVKFDESNLDGNILLEVSLENYDGEFDGSKAWIEKEPIDEGPLSKSENPPEMKSRYLKCLKCSAVFTDKHTCDVTYNIRHANDLNVKPMLNADLSSIITHEEAESVGSILNLSDSQVQIQSSVNTFNGTYPNDDHNEIIMSGNCVFTCQICKRSYIDQYFFFLHLKLHYEPPQTDGDYPAIVREPNVEKLSIVDDMNGFELTGNREMYKEKLTSGKTRAFDADVKVFQSKLEVEEFSDPEDLMDGIRVEMIDNSDEDIEVISKNLTGNNDAMKLWYKNDLNLKELDVLPKQLAKEQTFVCQKCNSVFFERSVLLNHLDECYLELKPDANFLKNNQTTHDLFADVNEAIGSEETRENDKCPSTSTNNNQLEDNVGKIKNPLKRKAVIRRRNSIITKELMKSLESTFVEKKVPNNSDLNIQPDKDEKSKNDEDKRTSTVYECQQCNRVFVHRNSMIYHALSHSGKRPHQCDECGKAFYTMGALKVHKRLHTNTRPYECEFCGKTFRQWGDLRYHYMSLHTEKKDFQCEYCGKEFARKYSLVLHRRIHTGDKKYQCEYCNKTFRASSYLKAHEKIHTGEKPHACDVCNRTFRVRSDMTRHMKVHQSKKDKQTRKKVDKSETNDAKYSEKKDDGELVPKLELAETPQVDDAIAHGTNKDMFMWPLLINS